MKKMDDYSSEYHDLFYYFQHNLAADPRLLLKHFVEQFSRRILIGSAVDARISFTRKNEHTSGKKEAIYDSVLFHTSHRKEAICCNRFDLSSRPNSNPFTKLSAEFSYQCSSAKSSNTSNKKNDLSEWQLTLKNTPRTETTQTFYSHCDLTIIVMAENGNQLADLELKRLTFLGMSSITIKKLCVLFFSHINTNISTYNNTNLYADIDRKIDNCIESYARDALDLFTVFEQLTDCLKKLEDFRNISYLNESHLIGKILIFLISIAMNDSVDLAKESNAACFTTHLAHLNAEDGYLKSDICYFIKVMLLLSERKLNYSYEEIEGEDILAASFFYISTIYGRCLNKEFVISDCDKLLKTKIKLLKAMQFNDELNSVYLAFSLCYSVMEYSVNRNKKSSNDEALYINESLFYVLRELLRSVCFEKYIDHQQYKTQPLCFAKHLLNLVFFHAENLIDIYVPSHIRQYLLSLVKHESGHLFYAELADLQHTLNIYIAGYNLLCGPHKLAQYMINGRANETIADSINVQYLIKGFSLAALSHKMGRLPSIGDETDTTIKKNSSYEPLVNSGILIENEANDLVTWFRDADPILAEHTFGSANYLLNATEQANTLYDNQFIIDKTNILTPALKAVIYNATPQYGFALKEQPVCALLVLLTELFEQEHSLDSRIMEDNIDLTRLKWHLPVLPYISRKSSIEYENEKSVFVVTLIHGSFNSAIVHMEILRLAQMYGRFKFADKQWRFNIKIVLRDNIWSEIKSDIANAVLETESTIRPLLLRWLNRQEPENMSPNQNKDLNSDSDKSYPLDIIELIYAEKPFANVDVKSLFPTLEKYMLAKKRDYSRNQ
jgi:hypothetical protein